MTTPPIPGLRDWLRLVLMYRAPHPESQRILEVVEGLLDRRYITPVLIHGEAGTGKEGLARALHQRHRDRRHPPVPRPPSPPPPSPPHPFLTIK